MPAAKERWIQRLAPLKRCRFLYIYGIYYWINVDTFRWHVTLATRKSGRR